MKTFLFGFLSLSIASAALVLTGGCDVQNSNAATEPTQVASAPPAPASTPASVATSDPATVVTPAALPPNISPASPLASVVRLTQSGVDQSIIMVYVTNSSRTFNLDADKIIYLTDLGMPNDLVRAMMQRDQELQQAFAAEQAAQQAQQVQSTQPAAEPAPVETVQATTAPAPVTVNYFNETLSPYGNWVLVPGYGRCWQPTACAYDPNWQPYCDRGHWVYTDCGWYWSSEYAWGATFHYGRWFRDTNCGWCWYPDTVWAPSWVTWRYSDNYCGWAPLPPRTYCQSGVGIVYQSGNVSLGLSFGLGASCYTFVPTRYFCDSHPRNYCASSGQVTQIYNNTTIINNIRVHGSGNNQIIINNGIPVQSVANANQSPINRRPVHELDPAFAHNRGYTSTSTPRFGQSPGNNSVNSPSQPGNPTTPPQNLPHHSSDNGNFRPMPSQFSENANNTMPAQWSSAPAVTQPERTRPVVATIPARSLNSASRHPRIYDTSPAPVVAANYNQDSQPAPALWQQPSSHVITGNHEDRQNYSAQNQIIAPPVHYNAQPQAQPTPQPSRNYDSPRNESHPNFGAPPVTHTAPQPQPQPSSYSPPRNEERHNNSSPTITPAQSQSPGNSHRDNQGWAGR